MMNILDTIAAHARARVASSREKLGAEAIRELALSAPPADGKAFEAALGGPELAFICEIKRASPSKGLIAPDFPYLDIAREYESAGADAVSCLTEPEWFLGSDEIFCKIRREISIPMLRKDFTVDEYQLYEAKLLGANAVLLICSILGGAEIEKYLGICEELGLAALVEAHNGEEIRRALSAGARIVGVNNRDLRDFTVDFSNAARLRELIPPEKIFVAESGVSSPADAAALRGIGADAVLVGEALMRSKDKTALLSEMREAAK